MKYEIGMWESKHRFQKKIYAAASLEQYNGNIAATLSIILVVDWQYGLDEDMQ